MTGNHIVPYAHPSLPIFSGLPVERQKAILDHFLIYYRILASAETDHIEFNDNLMLTWWALRELKMKPSSDLFSNLSKTDVIEIYDNEGVQIYRTLNFYNLTTYTMEDMLCTPWYELFSRDSKVTEQLMECMARVLKSETQGIIHPDVADHVVKETRNPYFKPRLVRCKLISSLEGPDKKLGFLHAFQVLGETKSPTLSKGAQKKRRRKP